MKELESLLIRITTPPGNRVKGKFISSQGLRKELYEKMKEVDTDKIAGLMGGYVEKKWQKAKAQKVGGTKSLAGLFNKRVKLKGTYKGKKFLVTLRKDGQISYKKTLYPSPTSVAKVVTGRKTISGWHFWHYKNEKNQWVRLVKLKK